MTPRQRTEIVIRIACFLLGVVAATLWEYFLSAAFWGLVSLLAFASVAVVAALIWVRLKTR